MSTTKSSVRYGQMAHGIIDGLPAQWRFAGRRGGAWVLERMLNGRSVEDRFVSWDVVLRIFV